MCCGREGVDGWVGGWVGGWDFYHKGGREGEPLVSKDMKVNTRGKGRAAALSPSFPD